MKDNPEDTDSKADMDEQIQDDYKMMLITSSWWADADINVDEKDSSRALISKRWYSWRYSVKCWAVTSMMLDAELERLLTKENKCMYKLKKSFCTSLSNSWKEQ
mgnify:CR=1 FL=1